MRAKTKIKAGLYIDLDLVKKGLEVLGIGQAKFEPDSDSAVC